ncbi:hypothetical protein CRUP_019153 [Coryphaenoides rupestris]|nr:hypothetical protein CRUP_019153 [Coryphaenoides rupestris]
MVDLDDEDFSKERPPPTPLLSAPGFTTHVHVPSGTLPALRVPASYAESPTTAENVPEAELAGLDEAQQRSNTNRGTGSRLDLVLPYLLFSL